MAIKKVFVLGSGTMGAGIAQSCAQSVFEVALCDTSNEILQKAQKGIAWSVGKLVEKGRVPGSSEEIMARIHTTTDLVDSAGADLVIEAVFENLELKLDLLAGLDRHISEACLVASNTSAIPISELAPGISHPENFLGLHFFNPVPMMQAVEVIRGILTSDEAFEAGRGFVKALGKEPIMVNRDVAGFVINRINYPATMEAMRLVEQGVTSCEDVDKGLKLASGRKMGIFEISDMVGLDVTYGGLMAMYKETGEERWFPPMILRRKVKAGHLGCKTGKGWYEYNPDGSRKE
jgi:3-hydroxybutyryl-CoA dehydrogenase